MRIILIALVLGCSTGCATPPEVQQSLAHELSDLQQLEAELLPLIPDADPIDFGSGVKYRPRDGWRIQLRSMQLRAAGLVAWSRDETFDQAAGVEALVAPALKLAQKNTEETE